MTTYAVPVSPTPSSMEFGLISNTWRFVSPFTGNQQTLSMPGARWKVQLAWNWLKSSEVGAFEAFMVKLGGGTHTFSTYNFFRTAPLGTMRGTLTVNGAHSAGVTTVSISGGGGQAATTLKAGDYLSVNGQFNMVVSDATANGSGVISAVLAVPQRAALSGGESVVWDKPTATFVQTDRQVMWQYQRTLARNFVLYGEELY